MADTMINAGGGLSKSKLALADATTADVLVGKKFYSGDKTLKTGELKGYVTSPSLSYNANRRESATPGKDNVPFHNSGYTRFFVQCTDASVAKISKDKVRVTVRARGGWACYGYSDFYAETSWTFDVTLD